MTLPGITQTINDGALGLATPSTTGVQVKLGCSSRNASPNVLQFFTDPTSLAAAYGGGPLVEAAAHVLQIAGGPVGVMGVNASVSGVFDAITPIGSSTGVIAITGAANDAYSGIISIVVGAPNLASREGQFQYSLDGGLTWSSNIALPPATHGTFIVPGTGATLTFTDGTWLLGDSFTFVSTAPCWTLEDLATAFAALFANPSTWGLVHVIGCADNLAAPDDSVALAAAVATQMAAAEASFRYAFAITECPGNNSDTDYETAFENFVSDRVGVAVSSCTLTSAISGAQYLRSVAWPVTARIAQQDVQRDVARMKADSNGGGALLGVTAITRDEYATPGLDEARFITLRTFPGAQGFFVTNGRLMAGVGSDFQYIQYRRIMDLACATNYQAMLPFVNGDDVRTVPVTGFINEIDARAVEAAVNALLRAQLTDVPRASAVNMVIQRNWNILSTQTWMTSVRVQPRGYSKFIVANIGFLNPALQAQAA